ncbi:MAG TPA: hypothetical protein VLF95_02855 [Vicinamibacteria bacterium]|nr:hypothetical protein [Vicinamibacteria bacterium]
MEAAIVLGLVMAFLVGGMTLALVMGYLSAEEARARKQAQRPGHVVRAAETIPSFFARPDRGALPTELREFDEALLARIESHIREEQALVSEFVEYPSVNSLYRRAPHALRAH